VLALSHIGVLPSYYKEGGYPRALLEPMSMGRPVITTTSEDCRGAVDEGVTGLLVPPRDAGALANAIARLADDTELRVRYGAASREKARREFDETAILGDALRRLGLVPG
jgi:glycosyltransferase involved in cell wall biosynthesis